MLLLVLVHVFVQYGKYNNGRLEFDVILMFKIYHNLSDLPFHNCILNTVIESTTFALIILKLNPNFVPILTNIAISFSSVLRKFRLICLMT